MAESPNTGATHIEPNQNQKEATANAAFDRISNFVTETLSLAISGDTSVTEAQFQQNTRLALTGTPGATFLLEVPGSVKKLFVVDNQSDSDATVQVSGGAGVSVTVPTTERRLLYTDGTDVTSPGGAGNVAFLDLSDTPSSYTALRRLRVNAVGDAVEFVEDPHTVAFYAGGTYTASQLLMKLVADRPFTLPSGLSGSRGHLQTAPADGSMSFDVQKNGASVGSVDFAQGANTATFTMASATSFVAGDLLEVVAPGTADSAAADLSVSFKGTKD